MKTASQFLIVVAVMLFTFSCRKDSTTPAVPSARLDSVNVSVSAQSNTGYKFYYDADGYVIKMVASGNNGGEVVTDSFVYDGSRKLLNDYNMHSNSIGAIKENYLYDEQGKLTRTEWITPGLNGTSYMLYNYNQDSKLQSVVMYQTLGGFSYMYSYTYNSMGNVTNQVDSFGNDVQEHISYTYDNRPNVSLLLKGLEHYNVTQSTFPLLSANNYVKRVYTEDNRTDSYEYIYNDKGYPVKVSMTGTDGASVTNTYFYK